MQIKDDIRGCVAFIGVETEEGIRMRGTAFFVHIETANGFFVYLVTAKHNIVLARRTVKKDAAPVILARINAKTGGFKYLMIPFAAWADHPDPTVDVTAALLLPTALMAFDFRAIQDNILATEEVRNKEIIGIGDEVFLIGLFASHYGRQRNVPVLRMGTIACMPEEQVDTVAYGPMDAYIVETRSIGGLSGSPVFVFLDGERVHRTEDGTPARDMMRSDRIILLGMMHGHWDAPLNLAPEIVADALGTEEGRINMGMAIVIPSEKIRETLDQPALADFRRVTDNAIAASRRSDGGSATNANSGSPASSGPASTS
ncbi:MAG: hypothetical protein JNL04_10470 [Rhodospirillaceae bacterium]|nr:hypothetical protein [Rhodospirillaceae bacterium]